MAVTEKYYLFRKIGMVMTPEMLPTVLKAMDDKGLLKEIYGDLAKPGVTQVGIALSAILGLGGTILWPLQLLNERSKMLLELNLQRYREKIANINSEHISPVPTEIGVPLAEKLGYVTDKDLRELYTTLLAKASSKETAGQVHPSFVNILSNISPDEALLIKELAEVNLQPFVSIRLTNPADGLWIELADIYFESKYADQMSFPDNLAAYVHNIKGLGLFEIVRDNFAAPYTRYDPIEAAARKRYENIKLLPEYTMLSFLRGKIEVTRLGWLFISACLEGVNQLPVILRGGR
jgi:hypothetical protein